MNKAQQRKFDSLYQEHLTSLTLQGKSDSTIDVYSRAVRRVTEFFDRCPDRLTTKDLKEYFASLVKTQASFKAIIQSCNIHKHITIHNLRHCYGTHPVEQGLNLRAIQKDMGQYGDILLHCDHCNSNQCAPKSCGHRSCQRCQNHDTTRWVDRQRKKLLPVEYFMVTFTVPYELRSLYWHNQTILYRMLFQSAISTLKDFGHNEHKLGSDLGMTAVMHTHTRKLDYHPHLHVIIPGGCLNKKRKQWKKLDGKYLFNNFALAKVFRARLLDAINASKLTCPGNVPRKWVVDCQHTGKGLPALKYLSRYLYRGVIRDGNVIHDDGTYITFRYKDSKSGLFKTRKEKGEVFLWLVLQHVLPKGFRRIRDYGFLHGNASKTLKLIQWILRVMVDGAESAAHQPAFLCSRCKKPMDVIGFRKRNWCSG